MVSNVLGPSMGVPGPGTEGELEMAGRLESMMGTSVSSVLSSLQGQTGVSYLVQPCLVRWPGAERRKARETRAANRRNARAADVEAAGRPSGCSVAQCPFSMVSKIEIFYFYLWSHNRGRGKSMNLIRKLECLSTCLDIYDIHPVFTHPY